MVDARIDARVDAYRPAAAPPFAVLTERKRRRDRRRVAAAGAVLAATAAVVAVAAVAIPGWDRVPGVLDRVAGGERGGGKTFALRPVGFQNDKAPLYTAATERCLALPGVTGGPVTDSVPAFYSLAAAGDDVPALRSCLAKIGADAEEIEGRPGERRGQAESIEQCTRGEAKADQRYIGLTETQVRQAHPGPVRVICRDRVFLDRTSDYQQDRLNIVVEQGTVIWAGRF